MAFLLSMMSHSAIVSIILLIKQKKYLIFKYIFQTRRSRDKKRKFSRDNNARLAARKQVNSEQIQSTPLIANLEYLKAAAALNVFASNFCGNNFPHF